MLVTWVFLLHPVFAGTVEDKKKAELKQLRSQISAVSQRLTRARSAESDTQGQLREAEVRIGRVAAELRTLEKRLKIQKTRLAGLEEEGNTLKLNLSVQRRALTRQIRAAYIVGRQDYLKILLNQENPALLGRILTYHDYFNQARSRRIKQLNSHLEQLVIVEKTIRLETEALRQLRSQQAAQKQELETQQQVRKAVLAGLTREIQREDSRLKRLEQDKGRLEQLLKDLQRMLADIPSNLDQHRAFSRMKRKLPWPYSGRIRHRFGSPRRLGNLKWQGVLISAPEGEIVQAVYHGRVAFADWLRGLGLLIILDHGSGFMSLYGHNQSLLKETGDWVEPGEPVATVGNSGGHNQSGVYFEIRRNGVPVNPSRWCRRMGAKSALVSP